jgi:hypothetical protein
VGVWWVFLVCLGVDLAAVVNVLSFGLWILNMICVGFEM